MKTSRAVIVLGVGAVIAAAASYWFGFMNGFDVGEAASAVGNGWVAVGELELINTDHLGGAKYYLETTVDDGLFAWSQLSKPSAARPALALLGRQLPDYAAPWLRDTENPIKPLNHFHPRSGTSLLRSARDRLTAQI
jgi:hypothetical protein